MRPFKQQTSGSTRSRRSCFLRNHLKHVRSSGKWLLQALQALTEPRLFQPPLACCHRKAHTPKPSKANRRYTGKQLSPMQVDSVSTRRLLHEVRDVQGEQGPCHPHTEEQPPFEKLQLQKQDRNQQQQQHGPQQQQGWPTHGSSLLASQHPGNAEEVVKRKQKSLQAAKDLLLKYHIAAGSKEAAGRQQPQQQTAELHCQQQQQPQQQEPIHAAQPEQQQNSAQPECKQQQIQQQQQQQGQQQQNQWQQFAAGTANGVGQTHMVKGKQQQQQQQQQQPIQQQQQKQEQQMSRLPTMQQRQLHKQCEASPIQHSDKTQQQQPGHPSRQKLQQLQSRLIMQQQQQQRRQQIASVTLAHAAYSTSKRDSCQLTVKPGPKTVEHAVAAAPREDNSNKQQPAAAPEPVAAASTGKPDESDIIIIDSDSDADEQPLQATAAVAADAAAASLQRLQLGKQQQQEQQQAAATVFMPQLSEVPPGLLNSRPSSLASAVGSSWAEVQAYLSGFKQTQQVVAQLAWGPMQLQVLHSDICRLQPSEWLNDELVNFYLTLVQARSNCAMQLQQQLQAALKLQKQQKQPQQQLGTPLRKLQDMPSSYIFSSFFYELLVNGPSKQYNYAAVQRWTLPKRTLSQDSVLKRQLLLFPINLSNTHWAVVAVWPQRRLLQYYDSSRGSRSSGQQFMRNLSRWLADDAKDKQVALPAGQLTCEVAAAGMPVQADGNSCGLFACSVCERLAAGWSTPFDFSQADMTNMRLGMALDILQARVR